MEGSETVCSVHPAHADYRHVAQSHKSRALAVAIHEPVQVHRFENLACQRYAEDLQASKPGSNTSTQSAVIATHGREDLMS